MGVIGVSSLGGSSASGLLQSIATYAPKSSGRLAGTSTASSSAYVLSGSKTDHLAGLYSSLGNMIATQRSSQTSSTNTPANKKREAALKIAAAKIDGGDIKGGRDEAKRLVAKNANDITAIRLVAVSYLVERDYVKAERYYVKAAALAPSDTRLKGDLANVRTLQKSDDEVLKEAKRKLESPSDRSAGLRLLQNLSARSPSNVDAYLAMAEGYRDNREPARVIGALQEALRYAGKNEVGNVVTEAKKLARQFPDVGVTHNILGRALEKAGQLEDAIDELQEATTIAPNNYGYKDSLAGAYAQRALNRIAAGQTLAASTDLHNAQRVNPLNSKLNEVEARLAAKDAQTSISGGRYTTAMSKLATAASKAPNDTAFKKTVADLYFRAGVHFHDDDDDSTALAAFQKAHELDPTSTTARRRVAELSYQLGMEARTAKDYDNAITHLERAHQTLRLSTSYGQDLAEAYNLRGQLREGTDDLTNAIVDYKKGIGIDPTNASLSANLSAALLQ